MMKPSMKRLSGALALLMLTGCATPPGKIDAAYVSPFEYSNLTCDQIREELIRVNRKLTEISGKQKSEANKDAVALGVGLIVFWPALFFMMGDDKKDQVARLKGEYEALEMVAIRKNCGFVAELEAAREQRKELEEKNAKPQ